MIEDPDAELVVRAGNGDRAAAQALMLRHLPKMMTLARRMLADQTEAEDAVQDAFMRLWTHASRWRPGAARFETWLYRVTLNQCYDRLRKRHPTTLEEALDIIDTSADPEQSLDEADVSAAVTRAIEDLPERQRVAILLCHHQGCGNIEAAEIMGVSVEALESLLARGRRTLKAKLKHLNRER